MLTLPPSSRIDLRPTSQASAASADSITPFPAGTTAEDPDAALSPPLHHNHNQQPEESSSRRLSGLRTVFNLNSNRRRLQNAPAAERIAALQRMRSDNEQQQRRRQRRSWRMSQQATVNDEADNDNEDDTPNTRGGLAGLSGDGIDGFAETSNDNYNNNNTLSVPDDSNRRRSRMSVRLQEVFGVRTRRPESVVFVAGSATAAGSEEEAPAAAPAAAGRAGSAAADQPPILARQQPGPGRPTVMMVNAGDEHDRDSRQGRQLQQHPISTAAHDTGPSDPPRLPPLNF